MTLPSGEVVISSGPARVNGARNDFLDIIVEMLRDADIPARLASADDIGPENQPAWVSRGEFEPCFVLAEALVVVFEKILGAAPERLRLFQFDEAPGV